MQDTRTVFPPLAVTLTSRRTFQAVNPARARRWHVTPAPTTYLGSTSKSASPITAVASRTSAASTPASTSTPANSQRRHASASHTNSVGRYYNTLHLRQGNEAGLEVSICHKRDIKYISFLTSYPTCFLLLSSWVIIFSFPSYVPFFFCYF